MEANYENALRYQVDEEMTSEVIAIDGCSNSVACSIVNARPDEQGRMIEIGVRVRRVCPGKRTALGILLHELDEDDAEYLRGMKTMTLPAHNEQSPRDIVVEGIRFVLPEDVSLAAEGGGGVRRLRIRTHVHYMDASDMCGCINR